MRSFTEIIAEKELKRLGYAVDFKIRPTHRFPKGFQVDLWGCFDICGYKPLELLYVSCKADSTGGLGAHKSEIRSFEFPPGVHKELWIISKDGRIRKERL